MCILWIFLFMVVALILAAASFLTGSETKSSGFIATGFIFLGMFIGLILLIIMYANTEKSSKDRIIHHKCYWEDGQPYIKEEKIGRHGQRFTVLTNLAEKLGKNIDISTKSVDFIYTSLDSDKTYYGFSPIDDYEYMKEYKLNK